MWYHSELQNLFQLDTISLWGAMGHIQSNPSEVDPGCVMNGSVGISFSASEQPPSLLPPSEMNQCCSLKITRNIIHFMHCWVNRMCWMLSDWLCRSRMCFGFSAHWSQITMQGVVGFKRCAVEAVQTAPWFWLYNSFLCGVMFLHRPSCWVRCWCQD